MRIASPKTSRRSSAKFNRPALHHIVPLRAHSMLAVLRQLAAVSGRLCKSARSCGAPYFDDHFDIRWGQNDIDRVLKQIAASTFELL
jgi:hypothetical protein